MTWEDLVNFASSENFVIITTGIGAAIASVWAAIAGARKGKPTAPSIASAVEASKCSAPLLAVQLAEVLVRMNRIESWQETLDEKIEYAADQQRDNRDILVRLDDRTRRR